MDAALVFEVQDLINLVVTEVEPSSTTTSNLLPDY